MASEPEGDPTVAEISEGDVLRAILARTAPAQASIIGPGDDAAVIAAASRSSCAFTASITLGWRWPVLTTAIPAAKSI